MKCSISATGPGKLTVGKLYGGILIYEIWKTTRFSNLEILAKMEKEMAKKMDIEGCDSGSGGEKGSGGESTVSLISGGGGRRESAEALRHDQNEEEREQYDQYDDDPNFSNRQRDYYNQR